MHAQKHVPLNPQHPTHLTITNNSPTTAACSAPLSFSTVTLYAASPYALQPGAIFTPPAIVSCSVSVPVC